MIRTYQQLMRLPTFEERYQYLRLGGVVGETTFGYSRQLNQALYTSQRWLHTRDLVITRDLGCDLGVKGFEIFDFIVIHHMNPISIEDLEYMRESVFDPEQLITTSKLTHKAIHFSNEHLLPKPMVVRRRNDTCPWK